MKPAEFHPEAEDEFTRAGEFYDVEHVGLGTEFTDEVEHAVRFVRAHPEAGTPVRAALRSWRVRRFPYSIIYREEPARLYVLAVAHHRRRAGYWNTRA